MSDGGMYVPVLLLGAYHGINPAMGWLFAVALGMQEQSGATVGRALVPIGLGHGLAIGAVVALAALAGTVVSPRVLKVAVAVILLGFGVYCLFRQHHPRGTGMQVGFVQLALWSFLMASAHGAGFMLLPLLLGSSANAAAHHAQPASDPSVAILATAVHTIGYLAVTGLVAWIVYRRIGLRFLRKAWINLHLIWAAALILSGLLTLLI